MRRAWREQSERVSECASGLDHLQCEAAAATARNGTLDALSGRLSPSPLLQHTSSSFPSSALSPSQAAFGWWLQRLDAFLRFYGVSCCRCWWWLLPWQALREQGVGCSIDRWTGVQHWHRIPFAGIRIPNYAMQS